MLPKDVLLYGSLSYKLDVLGNNCFNCLRCMVELHIPSSVRNIQRSFWKCYKLCRFVVDENSQNYSSIDGALYSKNHKLVACPNAHVKAYSGVDGTIDVSHSFFTFLPHKLLDLLREQLSILNRYRVFPVLRK